jgi:hypothetical protein
MFNLRSPNFKKAGLKKEELADSQLVVLVVSPFAG